MFKGWFQKREQYFGDFSFLEVDMHSHLIPGIDDGAKSLEESLSFIETLKKIGYKGLITTPHIISDIYPNTQATIETPFQQVKLKLPGFKLTYAAEYMINAEFEDLLDDNQLLTFGNNYVLIEMSYIAESANFRDMVFKLKVKGYQPILAHPERYIFLHNNYKIYQEIKDIGCLLQLNILSVSGYYGAEVKQVANKLLSDKLIDFAGTDLHHDRHLDALQQLTTSKQMSSLHNYGFQNASLAQ
jgi:protein-tyrosine phosphatase